MRVVDDLLWEVVKQVQETFGYYYVHVSTVEPKQHVTVCRAGWDGNGPRRDLLGWSIRLRDQGLVGWVAWSGQPLLVPEVDKDARYYFDERFPDTRSELTVPIVRGDRTVGVLDAQDRKPGAFDNEDLLVLETLARQLSVALENAELFEQLTTSEMALKEKAEALDGFLEMTARAQEEDRQRIALDLHDGVVQMLIGAYFEVETIRMMPTTLDQSAVQRLAFVSGVLNDCSAEMRRVIFDLYPPDLSSLGLVPTLQRYLATVDHLFRVHCRFSVVGDARRMEPERELAAFRFVQEAVSNVSKHAEGATVKVILSFAEHEVTIRVQDDGPGFDQEERRFGHFGIQSMQRNATRAHGRFELVSRPGTGTTAILVVPIEESS